MFPLKPPRDWFETPEPDHAQPLTIDADGRVTGHLAPWKGCHTSFGQCVPPPRSPDGYASFHVGALETAEGDMIPVGKIVYGNDAKHAPLDMAIAAASQHYDDNGHVGAYVRATDGRHGIWLTGALKSDITDVGLRDLRANPPSGDWRDRNGRHTLVAALAVPVPGFPISREALAASGELPGLILSYPMEDEESPAIIDVVVKPDGRVMGNGAEIGRVRSSRVIPKILVEQEETVEPRSKEFIRQRALIASGLTAAALTTKSRKALSRSAFAIPEDRAYPIHDRSHAATALARASGKPEEARVRRAVCRRYPDMPACKSK